MPPPFGTEQARNTEAYFLLHTHSYSDAAHISIGITASCPANIECSQKLILKGRGSEKRPYNESLTLHLSQILHGYGGLLQSLDPPLKCTRSQALS